MATENPPSPTPSNDKVMEAMSRYGGGFEKALCELWRKGDKANKAKIEATWPEKFVKFASPDFQRKIADLL